MVLSRILGIQAVRLQPVKWDCPEESLGALVGPLHGGRYQCWEAAGKARQIFTKLSTEIKEYLEASTVSTCDIISWSMYMIGRTPDKAAPKVLICSTNSKVRKSIRKSIEYSGIMGKYPGVGLGDTSTLPDRHIIRLLSREAIEALVHGNCELESAVLVEKNKPELQKFLVSDRIAEGRRAFVINPVDYSLHPITTGPAIEDHGRIYLLTAAHGFVTVRNPGQTEEQVLGELDDCDFDGMSDGEDGVDQHTLELGTAGSSDSKVFAKINPFSRSGPSGVREGLLDETEGVYNQEPCEVDVSNLEFYGRLALSSATGNRPTLDYALIEQRNILSPEELGPYVITLRDAEMIGPEDADIIACLGEAGQVEGEITATPTYMHLPGWRQFQEVYPVRLKSHQFSVGDSGAGVFNRYNQSFYGHIVAGGPGTNIAYVVPAMQTLGDIQVRLGQKPPPITMNEIKQIAQEGLFYSMVVGLTTISGFGLYVLMEHYLKVFNREKRSWSESMKFYFKFVFPVVLVTTFGFMVGWCYIFLPRELKRRSKGAATDKQSGSEFLTQQGRSDKNPRKIG